MRTLERKQAEAAQAVARLSSEAEQVKLALLEALQAAGNRLSTGGLLSSCQKIMYSCRTCVNMV